MMSAYLQSKENSGDDTTTVPKLVLFKLDRQVSWKGRGSSVLLRFPVAADAGVELESAQLRMLLPPRRDADGPATVQVNLVLGARRRRPLAERTVYPSRRSPKWSEIDVGDGVASWLGGGANLGLELVCLEPGCRLEPLEAGITGLVRARRAGRAKRSPYHNGRRTDCQKGKGKKRRCCRQNMKVTFSKLDFPEMNFIVEPKVYEAGYCHGLCPPNYNHATNHSRIQSLIHQMERRNSSRTSKRSIVPKACCAPSKLGPLEILLVDKDDPSKLMLEKWDNMKVIECACS
ncbi:unnamed protein product [Phyllotreta striolata]|nr:unnamed protein product [Phyllotreta striolata]